MANVTLRLMTMISSDVGLTYINYTNVNTLSDIIDQFMRDHGRKIRKSLVNKQGNLESHVIIMVNGRNYLFLEELKTKLNDGDEVILSPPLIGG